MRTHVLPRWADWPVSQIDHLAVQEWITELGRSLAPGTVTQCLSVLQMILATAVRSRVIAVNPAGVKVAGSRKPTSEPATISREAFLASSSPLYHPSTARSSVRPQERACDGESAPVSRGPLSTGRLRVVQVAVETAATVTVRPYPKSKAGIRSVPLPTFVVDALKA